MTVYSIITTVRAKGIMLWQENGQLKMKAPKGALTDDIRDQITAHKSDIVAFLSQASVTKKVLPLLPINRKELDSQPLSFVQKRLWIMSQWNPENAGYNIPVALTINGELDILLLNKAVNVIIARHEILRTVFPDHEGLAQQKVLDGLEFKLETIDLSLTKNEKPNYREAKKLCEAEATTPFSLAQGPLIRGKVIKLAPQERILLLNMHHIVSDDWSVNVFFKELLLIIDALLEGKQANLPAPPVQYLDYSVWQRQWLEEGGELKRQLAYWQQKLAGVPESLDLATDYPRPRIQSFDGASQTFTIDAQLTAQLKKLAEHQGCTLYMMLLAIFKVQLYRYTGQEDICLGSAMANRQLEETHGLIGMFVNTLALRTLIESDDTFVGVLDKVKTTCIEAYEHQDTPFEKIVDTVQPRRNLAVNPLFQIMVSQNIPLTLSKENIEPFHLDRHHSKFDMAVEFTETSNGLAGLIEYCTALFKQETIKRVINNFIALCRAVTAHPTAKIVDLDFLTQAEKHRLMRGFNNTGVAYAQDRCIQELFAQQAVANPDKTALIVEDEQLSYQQLYEKSCDLALFLQSLGVKPDSLVGLCLERSVEMMVGVQGILLAGGAYVPLNPDYPDDRLAYMLEDSQASIVLCQGRWKDKLSLLVCPQTKLIALDESWEAIARGVEELKSQPVALRREVRPHHLAYVIYTSGSTGKPKGVLVEHRALMNRITWMQSQYPLREEDVVLQKTPFSFDVSVWEFVWPLMAGAAVVLANPWGHKEVFYLEHLIRQRHVTTLHFVPSMLHAYLDHAQNQCPSVRQLFCSGEALDSEAVRNYKSRFPRASLHNLYGPTEAAIDVTFYDCSQLSTPFVPIGSPISNTQIYILDRHDNLQPLGVPGELCIAGDGLARGYHNRHELTGRKFVANPFNPGSRMYKSGDLARWMEDGNIEYLGRIDTQVKIRGFRIETGEIESNLSKYSQIKECVVVAQGQGANKKLVAFYVATETNDRDLIRISNEELKKYLRQFLPDYMLPSAFVSLESIPLTQNGKINRRALEGKEISAELNQENRLAPGDDIESRLVDIWAQVLDLKPEMIGVNNNFFDVGGNSISAVTLAASIEKTTRCKFSPVDLFKYSTVRGISRYIQENTVDTQEKTVLGKQDFTPFKSPEDTKEAQSDAGDPEYYEDSLAIVGISCHLPEAEDHWQFWKNLIEGRESIQLLSREEVEKQKVASEILDNPDYVPLKSWMEGKEFFDPEFFQISSGNAALMDPQFRQLLMHSWKAVEDAGYTCEEIEKTSVFISVSNNFYQSLAARISSETHVMKNSEEFVAWVLAQGGTIPTMISYQLGLKGPSAFVHSNCSSSLTGLYHAYQSLQSNDVDYALVGAATLSASLSLGYIQMPGMNFSSDGHCKTFDAKADGMVDGEGVGVILVRRAKDAIRDGDHIYSLIRGISANNDGSDKVGFYAPSVSGQTSVILNALEKTQINPESIGYVEAHGTGTALGDPIEVRAISEAYEKYTDKKQFCAIGSVKPNIGHLDTAAGLAGCIKLAISLYYKKFPPIINYKNPNPQIDFKNSPFYVLDQEESWSKDQYPKRAALSSFGIGGTNTHAILEEYTRATEAVEALADSTLYAIPLSAQREDVLREYAQKLLAVLDGAALHPIKLSEMAFTLQTGRKEMKCRVVFVVETRRELAVELQAFIENKKSDGYFQGAVSTGKKPVESLEEDEDYRELIKHWFLKKKIRKLAQLWINGTKLNWKLLYNESYPLRTSLPTYPFAKVRCWIDTSLSKPQAAATDKAGATAVLHPLLHTNTSDFSHQCYSSVFSGKEFFLADHQINEQKVFPAVAYLEMARAAVMRAMPEHVESMTLQLRNIVWVQPIVVTEQKHVNINLSVSDSGQIGYQIVSNEAENLVVHCEGKAEFSNQPLPAKLDIALLNKQMNHDSIDAAELYATFHDTGTHYDLAYQVVKNVRKGQQQLLAQLRLPAVVEGTHDEYTLHPSLMDGALQASEVLFNQFNQHADRNALPFALESLRIGSSCAKDALVWTRLAPGSKPEDNLIKLDIDLCDQEGNVCVQMRGFSFKMRAKDHENHQMRMHLASPAWQSTPVVASRKTSQIEISTPFQQHHVILCEVSGIQTKQLEALLPDSHCLLIEKKQDYDIAERFAEAALVCFERIQAILKGKPKRKVLIQWVVTNDLEQSIFVGLSGLFKTASLENPNFVGQIIQIDEQTIADQLAQLLLDNQTTPEESLVKYVQGERYTLEWQSLKTIQAIPKIAFSDKGAYLITGGLGGLGVLFTREILQQIKNGRIILVGRSELTDAKKEALAALTAQGTTVEYQQMDISDAAQVDELISSIVGKYNQLNGILHSAGIISDNFILKKTPEEFDKVLAPKVKGTFNLDQVCRNIDLDFMVLFSSDSALGSIGQADYAAANGFMDQFAAYRNQLVVAGQRQGLTLSINWPLWQDGGMKLDQAILEMQQKTTGMRPMTTPMGMQAFYQCLELNYNQVLVSVSGSSQLQNKLPDTQLLQPVVAQEERHLTMTTSVARTESLVLGNDDLLEKTQEFLKKQFAELFKLSPHQIDSQASLETYGIDSILAINITNQLEKTFGALSKTLLFEYHTIHELAEYFIEAFQEKLISLLEVSVSGRQKESIDQTLEIKSEAKVDIKSVEFSAKRFYQRSLADGSARSMNASQETKPGKDDLIAIIGVSGRYPESPTIEEYWNNLRDGRDCIIEVPEERWDWREYYTQDRTKDGAHYSKWGGFIAGVNEFDPKFFNISPKEAEILDPQERLFLQHAWMAVEDAGYTRASLQIPHGRNLPGQVGVYVGVMYNEYQLFGAEISQQGKRMGFANSAADVANRVSYALNVHGPSFTVDTLCSSSLTSIHLACQDLKQGRTDMAIAGGVNVSIHPNKYLILSSGQYISTTGHCHSFGAGGDGYIPGEGVGALILKRLSDAEKSSDHIYGIIRGSALNHGGKPTGYTVPNPQAQAALISQALEESNTNPRHISYIEAHGTGTPLGDPIEITALTKAFHQTHQESSAPNNDRGFCTIGSVKSNIGHCESAAGVAGVTKILMQMKHQQIAPSLHSNVLNPNIDFEKTPFVVNQTLKTWEPPVIDGKKLPRIAGISSFGAGGANAHIILEEYPPTVEPFEENTPVVIPLSARTPEQLRQKVLDLIHFIGNEQNPINLASAAYTLQVGREAMEERLAVIANSIDQLLEKLQTYIDTVPVGGSVHVEGVYRGQVKKHKESIQVISQDDDMRETIDKWIARKKIEKLLDLWVRGLDMDWQKFYVDGKPKRMSLPAYPFAKERYWWNNAVEDGKLTPKQWVDQRIAATVIHPMLHENTSKLGQQSYSTTFTGEESYLKDDLANGQKVLPAVAYLEMARAAIEHALPAKQESSRVELYGTVWGPLFIVDKNKQVKILLFAKDHEHIDFEVCSDDTYEEIVHCQGHAVIRQPPASARLDIAQIKTQLGKNQFLSEVHVPGTNGNNVNGYVLHPGLLDSTLETGKKLLAGSHGSLSFPSAVESVYVISAYKEKMIAWVRYAQGMQPEHDMKLDIDLCDEQGNIGVQMRGVRYLPASTPSLERVPKLTESSPAFVPKKISVIPELNQAIGSVSFRDRQPMAIQSPPKKPTDIVLLAPGALLSEETIDTAGKSRITLAEVACGLFTPGNAVPPPALVSLAEYGNGVYAIQINIATLSKEVTRQLLRALDTVKQFESVKVLLIRGGKADFLHGDRQQFNEAIEQKLYQAIGTFPYPVIAVMQGNAGGAGFLLGALCDFMIGSEQATYFYTHPSAGLYPTAVEDRLWKERFGIARAYDFMYFSTQATGSELKEKGWSFSILPQDQIEPYVQKLALTLVKKPQKSLRLLKQHLARHILNRVSELTVVDPVSLANDRQPASAEGDCAVPSFKNIELKTHKQQVLVIHISPVEDSYSTDDCLTDLTTIFEWVEQSFRHPSMVIKSDYPAFLQESEEQFSIKTISDFSKLLLKSKIPVVAVLDATSTGFAWLLGQFCDGCVYHRAAYYSTAGIIQNSRLAQVAAMIFAYRFGHSTAKEILLSGTKYSGFDLQQRIKTLPVVEEGQTLPAALTIATSWATWPASVVTSWKQYNAIRIQEKMNDLPVVAESDEAFEPVTEASTQVSLRSTVVSATADPEGILVVKMEDREAKNMFSEALTHGIIEVFEHIKQTPAYKVVILTGFENYFASGGTKEDLLAIQGGKAKFTDTKFYHLAMECQVPVISAMQGHAIGAGWSYGMFADFVLFSEESKYLSPYMNFGFTPGAGATFIFPEKIGYDLARETLLIAQEISGSELKDRGVLLSVVPRKRVFPTAMTLARQVAQNTRGQLIAIKNQLTHQRHHPLEETYQLELAMHEETFVGQSETLVQIQQHFVPVNGNTAPNGHTVSTTVTRDEQSHFVPANATHANHGMNEGGLPKLIASLKKYLAQELHMPEHEIDEDAEFIDLGLDSITGVTWVRKINDQYNLTIQATNVYSYPTLNDFSKYVKAEVEKRGTIMAKEPTTTVNKPVNKTKEMTPPEVLGYTLESTLPKIAATPIVKKLTSWRKPSNARIISGSPTLSQVQPIAIVGMAGQFPQAKNLEEFWDNITQSKDCISKVPEARWNPDTYYSKGEPKPGKTNSVWQGSLEEYDRFDPLFFNISPTEAESMDPQQRVFLQTCWHTIEDAGYDAKTLSGSKCGVFVGSATGDYQILSRELQLTAKGFTGTANSILAARISYFLNLQGPCLTIDTACSSSLVAMATACDSLIMGNSDLALAGGVCIMATPDLHVKSSQSGMLSPDGRCYTFDNRANGFVPGEGVGVVMLKRLADAEKDQDRILGVIQGWGTNQDGKTNGITAPSPESQRRLMQEVYDKFRIDPANIHLVEAHGTGTKLGDPIEVAALKESFSQYTQKKNYCAIGSVKSNIGHCMAAAGVAGVIKTVMALKNRQVPPTINFEQQNEHINLKDTPFYVSDRLQKWEGTGGREIPGGSQLLWL